MMAASTASSRGLCGRDIVICSLEGERFELQLTVSGFSDQC